jgi:hypothetical protein
MARRGNSATVDQATGEFVEPQDLDVDVAQVDDEQEEAAAPVEVTEGEAKAKEPKAKKEPARGELPEGHITPVGLAKVINERKLHTNREGEIVDVAPQMVYSYIKNAPKEDPYPSIDGLTDSLGKARLNVAEVEKAVAWWIRKNERAAARKANGAAKAAKKTEKKTEKAQDASSAQSTEDAASEAAVEAE